MRVLLPLVLMLLSGCATLPNSCSQLAPETSGWERIIAPPDADAMISLLNSPSEREFQWYVRDNSVYRAVSCSSCSGVAEDFMEIDGSWLHLDTALQLCHPASAP